MTFAQMCVTTECIFVTSQLLFKPTSLQLSEIPKIPLKIKPTIKVEFSGLTPSENSHNNFTPVYEEHKDVDQIRDHTVVSF